MHWPSMQITVRIKTFFPLSDDVETRQTLARTMTEDSHDADDEQDSTYDEERPSVDLSFLE